MKKNLILLGIAVALGIFTYVFQELGDRKRFEEAKVSGMLLDVSELGKLVSFKTPGAKILKEGESYFVEPHHHLAKVKIVEGFLERLSYLRVKRVLPKDTINEENYLKFFPNPNDSFQFQFEKGSTSFLIGKKMDFDQSFYVEFKNKGKVNHLIVFDSKPMDQAYMAANQHRDDSKYKLIKSLLYAGANYFEDRNLFRIWRGKQNVLKSVRVENKRNRPWALLLEEGKTKPEAPFGIDPVQLQAFQNSLVQLNGSVYFPLKSREDLEELVSTMEIESSLGKVTLELFKKHKGSDGYFILSSLDQQIYQMQRTHVESFFYNIQHFWILHFAKTKSIQRIEISWRQVWEGFDFIRGESFKASAAVGNAVHKSFHQLITTLEKRADFFTNDPAFMKEFKMKMRMRYKDKIFRVMVKKDQLLVADEALTSGLVYHFSGSPLFPLRREEYFQ